MLARPLAEVGGAARRIAEGDYAARVPRDGPEELASLADSFNQMAASLERQEAMRRDFIANAAHELRTPLTNLQGYLEALRDGVIEADRATYDSLLDEAERLVRLSHSLDALAEGDAATSPPRLEELDLAVGDPGRPRARPADARTRRSAPRRRRAGAPSGPGQSRPPRPGPRQPAVERHALHAGRRARSPSGPNGARPTSWSRSRTPATASRRPTSSASSSASIASRSRAIGRAAAPGIGLAIVKQLVEAGRRPGRRRVAAKGRRGSGSASRPDARCRHGMAMQTIPVRIPRSPNHWTGRSRSPRNATATMIVTAGPNDAASPTIHVGAVSSPVAKATSPTTSRTPASTSAPTMRGFDQVGPPSGRCPSALPARRARIEHGHGPDRRVHDPGDRVDLDPGHRLESHVGGDRHQREEHERDEGEDDARAGEPGRAQPAIEGERGQQHTDRRDRRAERLERAQRFAPEHHRQDDRQPAERRDHAADDRDRPELETREIRQVGAGADQPEEHGERDRGGLGRDRRAGGDEDREEQDRGHRLHPGGHAEAADDPAAESGDDVERAPEQGGRETGQESEGHRRSLAGRDRPRATIPNRSPVRRRGATTRGDVAQLEEHCVRIAGVRGSSPLISTTTSRQRHQRRRWSGARQHR